MRLRKKRQQKSNVFIKQMLTSRTHTAVASAVYRKYKAATGDAAKTVIVSTASPYKFPVVAVGAVTGKAGLTDFEALAQLLHEIRSGSAPAVDGLETAQFVIKQQWQLTCKQRWRLI